MKRFMAMTVLGVSLAMSAVAAENPHDPDVRYKAQQAAMAKLSALDGEWRGTAWSIAPTGVKSEVIQTERIGPFLDDSVKLIEGRAYGANGEVKFNALALISFDPATGKYGYRAHAQSYGGDFEFEPTADGFKWKVPMGTFGTTEYTAVVKDGTWHEVGYLVTADGKRTQVLEMNLKRIGDSKWPLGTPVGPK